MITDAFPTRRGRMEYVCTQCGARRGVEELLYTCPECGGVFLLEDLDFERMKETPAPVWRELFDARRATRNPALRGIFRFYELMAPVLEQEDIICLGEGDTPIIEAAPALRGKLGVNFAFKNEGQNPSASFKDRGMARSLQLSAGAGAHARMGRGAHRLRLHRGYLCGGCAVCILCGGRHQERGAAAPRQSDAPAALAARWAAALWCWKCRACSTTA